MLPQSYEVFIQSSKGQYVRQFTAENHTDLLRQIAEDENFIFIPNDSAMVIKRLR